MRKHEVITIKSFPQPKQFWKKSYINLEKTKLFIKNRISGTRSITFLMGSITPLLKAVSDPACTILP